MRKKSSKNRLNFLKKNIINNDTKLIQVNPIDLVILKNPANNYFNLLYLF